MLPRSSNPVPFILVTASYTPIWWFRSFPPRFRPAYGARQPGRCSWQQRCRCRRTALPASIPNPWRPGQSPWRPWRRWWDRWGPPQSPRLKELVLLVGWETGWENSGKTTKTRANIEVLWCFAVGKSKFFCGSSPSLLCLLTNFHFCCFLSCFFLPLSPH